MLDEVRLTSFGYPTPTFQSRRWIINSVQTFADYVFTFKDFQLTHNTKFIIGSGDSFMTVSKVVDFSSRDIIVIPNDVLVIRNFPSIWIMFSTEMTITEEDQYEIEQNDQVVDTIRPVIKGFHINVAVRSPGKKQYT